MKGSIYVSQKCHKCGSGLGYVEGRGILQCPKHPDVNWTGNCRVKFGRTHSKRFKTVNEAERHLTYLRAQTDHNVFDVRDWQKDAPLSFLTLRNQFLKHKHRTGISSKQIRHIEYVLEKAGRDWDKMNIKQITEAEIDDFFNKNHEVGNKTLANWKSVLNHFWTWVVRRERRQSKIEMPVFPEIKFKLAWRNIVDIDTQESILNEISRISFDINPRIWLGVKLLTLYPKIRPGELRNVQESHINLAEQWIVFPDPKEGEPKFIHLVSEDCELIKSLWEPRGLPQMYFFRHLQSRSGIQAGRQFGPKYFKTWWDRACKNLGIIGIDLYGGTRHSTVTALGKVLSPEQIQRGATGHASDAFKRYFLPNLNEAHVATRANHDIRKKKTGKIMTFREKKS